MARLARLTVRWTWAPLLHGKMVLPMVWVERPTVRLLSDTTGRQNWDFSDGATPTRPQRSPIEHLIITGGVISYLDTKQGLNFDGTISTDETAPIGRGVSVIRGALVVGGAKWARSRPLMRASKVLVQTRLLAALGGTLDLPLVEADGPAVRLFRDASGRANWQIDPDQKPFKFPPISHLIIKDGALTYYDAKTKTDFVGRVSSSETLYAKGRGTFQLEGRGRLNAAPFLARISGGALVNVDATRPYPFEALIQAGTNKVAAYGIIAHPFDFGHVSGKARVSGLDFSDLYHLTGIALPNTPPYQLAAAFVVSGKTYAFRGIAGRMGESDLAGAVAVNATSERPLVTAVLASRRLKLADLAAVVGGVPKNTAGRALSPAQKAMAAKLKAEHRFLPDAHLDVSRMLTTDARVTYRAASVDAKGLPIRALSLKLDLDHGLLTVDPLAMTLPQGSLVGRVRLDARGATPAESMDIKLTDARLETLMGGNIAKPPLTGAVYGRLQLAGRGDSVRAAAANANGALTVVIPGGEVRQAFAEMLGIDVTKGLFLLLAKNQTQTPIRCAVADFRATNGILTAQHIVFDTGVVLAQGKGQIDLRNETINLEISGKPKKFRLVRIGAPITVKGSLIEPKFGVSVGKAAGQLAVAGVLGAVVAPLAVILPFVSPGLAKNADCGALTSEASGRGATLGR